MLSGGNLNSWKNTELLKMYPTSMQNMETSQSHIVATANKYLAV